MAFNQVPNYVTDPDLEPHLDALVEQVKERARFSELDNLITPPSDKEIANAIKDSLHKINIVPPESSFGWNDVLFGDKRLLPIIYKQSIKNVLEVLVADWTGNGDNIRIEEFEIASKLSDYQALLGQLDAEIERDLTPFKQSQQLGIRGQSAGATSLNPLVGRYTFLSGTGGFWGRWPR